PPPRSRLLSVRCRRDRSRRRWRSPTSPISSVGPVASAGVLGRSVSLFFANGGTSAYVVRAATRVPGSIAGYGDPAGAADLYSLDVVETFNLLCLPATARGSGIFRALSASCRILRKAQGAAARR